MLGVDLINLTDNVWLVGEVQDSVNQFKNVRAMSLSDKEIGLD